MAELGPVSGDVASSRRFLTFRMDDRLYAVPAEEVSEVIRVPASVKVPQGPKSLIGIANLRGAVLPLANLRSLLGRPDAALPASARAIVLDGASPVALTVDAVEALVSVGLERVETRQAELAAEPGERLRGAFQAGPGAAVAKILDLQALLAAAFTHAARTERKAAPRQSIGAVAEGSEAADDGQMLATFDVADQEYALALDSVREILPAPETLAVVPRTESLVLGVTSYRETLLPLLSLRGLLGFPVGTLEQGGKVIVAAIGGVTVGLVADRMRSIFRAEASLVEATPTILAARTGGEARISAIYRGDGGRRLISILAPDQLFREDVMQRLETGPATAQPGSKRSDEAAAEELQFVVFRLGDDEYALPISAVDEVAQAPAQVTRVPKTPKFLEGVINLRGRVLPIVDQRRRFDLPKLEDGARRRLIVVRSDRHRAGLIVDSVSEVLRCAANAIEPAPQMTEDVSRLMRGVINREREGRIVLILDPDELLSRAERGLLNKFEAQAERGGLVIKVLVVDDSALVRKLLGQVFAAEPDFETAFARNGVEAMDQLQAVAPDVITLDIHMPQMDGLACLDRIMLERPCPVVMVSSLTAAGAEATLEALRLGAIDFIAKPAGAVSLHIDEWAPLLVEKVRAAAGARLKSSLRLKDRVRHRIGGAAAQGRRAAIARDPRASDVAATGDGLVLVGTSTGGPPALEALLTPLPADFPWPIVVAQHMPASFTGPLARRLDGLCALTVTEVAQPTPLKPGCVYIGRGDADVIISRRAAGLVAMAAPAQSGYPWHPSTDRLVRTAMEHLAPAQLIGVLMTGMGYDGAEAMALLRTGGGRTIAEAEETAVVWGMPGELVKMGGADWVLPLQRIADRLQALTP